MCGEKEEGKLCECGGRFNRFVEPRLLLLLKEKKSYGYELMGRLEEFQFPYPSLDTATVYRTLRNMESDGLVTSEWVTSESGPPKRMYEITIDGEDRLHAWALDFEKRKKALELFIRKYDEEKNRK